MEEVRLVIWDLDETFWRGTLTEGGISEYVMAHHEVVIELCRRGIMNSVCSKNNEPETLEILRKENILQYFIFPSISWEPKAPRIVSIIESVQLRPSTVMFIDDNQLNRAEAAHFIPEMQIEDEKFLPKILEDPRLRGTTDIELSRLAQYKVLEKRRKDQNQIEGGTEDFLRSCDISVTIDYDVLTHIDRAIELINRTNQLNFTKRRLPEELTVARRLLTELIQGHDRQAGLVRVVDKYGDYGLVGFYLVQNGIVDEEHGRLVQRLEHFCFSCRTLGMMVEAWLYDFLLRPRIDIVGEVLTDIFKPHSIDWIRMGDAERVNSHLMRQLSPEIRMHGGCEANSIAHYLTAHTKSIKVTGNFHSGVMFSRVNGSTLLLSASDRFSLDLKEEAMNLGIPSNMLSTDFFHDVPEETVFIVGAQLDIPGQPRYRHRQYGWEICVEPHGLYGVDLVATPWQDLIHRISALPFSDEAKEEITKIVSHVHNMYESRLFSPEQELRAGLEQIFNRIPVGSKLVLMTDHNRVRVSEVEVHDAPYNVSFDEAARSISKPFPFVGVVSFRNVVHDDNEIRIGGNHFERMVYLRMADEVIRTLGGLNPK